MSNKAKLIVCCLFAAVVCGCAPSLQYRLGQGFYSDTHAKTQVQAAANAGKVKNLGRFSVDAGGCGNYSQDATDRNIIIPAIKSELSKMGANAADNVVANERWFDFVLGLLIIPGLLACSNWTISGEALLVEQQAMNMFQHMRKISGVGESPMWLMYKKDYADLAATIR